MIIDGRVGTFSLTQFGFDLPEPPKEFQKKATIRAVQMKEQFCVHTEEGSMLGRPGDWLAEGAEGELWPIKASIFEKTYEEVENVGN